MKKITTVLAVLLVTVSLSAQVGVINKIIKKYQGQEGVTVVNISPELFKIASALEITEIEDAEFPVDKLSAVKVLAIENEEILANNDFYEEVMEGLNTEDFAEVLTVNDGGEDVRMWLRTEDTQIREFLLLVSSEDEGVLVYISGDFNMSDIEGLAESFGGIEELEALGDIEIN